MSVLLIAVLAAVAFIVAYNTYGRWLGSRLFELTASHITPAVRLRDDSDFVPTPRSVVFGHHFTSIAGVGPIVGPAIAVFWGWLPALLWVVFGSILIGAVHDFGSLVVSLRNDGQTIGDVAARLINRRARLLFLSILFLSLTIVLAIFGLVIASVFKQFPESIFPCLVQIPIAIVVGATMRRSGTGLLVPSLLALLVMYLSVYWGNVGWLGEFNHWAASWSIIVWSGVLLAYCFVASVLPVWALLQPRDFINSLQLLSALGLIVIGLIAAAFFGGAPIEETGERLPLVLSAPAINANAFEAGAPPLWPFLFITVACGAVSGFHCLVASGTTSKQLKCETDARSIGFGSMLIEAFLATLVILACAAGLTLDGSAWESVYSSWSSANGLGEKVGAFVSGSGNFVAAIGIPPAFAVALMGVLVASFAGTTLDTSCRLQRYVIQELASALGFVFNKYVATLIAVVLGFALATLPKSGQLSEWSWSGAGLGGLVLWPLFGATNQLLAGLSFTVILFYLHRRGKPIRIILIPLAAMLLIPAWAMFDDTFIGSRGTSFLAEGNWLLVAFATATLALEAWMITEALLLFPKLKRPTQSE